MSFSSMRMAWLLSACVLMPADSWAQSASAAAAPALKLQAMPQASTSMLDITIEAIAASANGRAVLDKDFPGLLEHPMYAFFKTLSLNQIAALSDGRITADMLAQARTDLSTLPLKPVARNAPPADIEDVDPPPPPPPPGKPLSSGSSYPN